MKKSDYRQMHPLVIHAKKQDKLVSFNRIEIYEINNTKFEFVTPNIVTMFINISHREYIKAKEIFRDLINPIIGKKEEFAIEDEKLTKLYDYMEAIQISVIFSYNAIEAFVNIAIPEKYIYTTKNSKGINEAWNKETIQRWMSTSDKLCNILPNLRNIQNPSSQKFWDDFKKLESLRNDIIHPKYLSKELNVYNDMHREFFNPKVFDWIKSIKDVITYFCKGEYSEYFFPIGFGPKKIEVIEIDDFDEYFQEIK